MLRSVIVSMVVGVCIAGAAFAQSATQAAFEPRYEGGLPNGSGRYPVQALNGEMSGYADVCCTVRSNRSLHCSVAREWPGGSGFGHASERLAETRRLTRESYAELQARQNQTVHVSTIWTIAPISEQAANELAAARGTAANVCTPGVRAPEPLLITVRETQ